MQIKATLRSFLQQSEWLGAKPQVTALASDDVKPGGNSAIAVGSRNLYRHYCGGSSKNLKPIYLKTQL